MQKEQTQQWLCFNFSDDWLHLKWPNIFEKNSYQNQKLSCSYPLFRNQFFRNCSSFYLDCSNEIKEHSVAISYEMRHSKLLKSYFSFCNGPSCLSTVKLWNIKHNHAWHMVILSNRSKDQPVASRFSIENRFFTFQPEFCKKNLNLFVSIFKMLFTSNRSKLSKVVVRGINLSPTVLPFEPISA